MIYRITGTSCNRIILWTTVWWVKHHQCGGEIKINCRKNIIFSYLEFKCPKQGLLLSNFWQSRVLRNISISASSNCQYEKNYMKHVTLSNSFTDSCSFHYNSSLWVYIIPKYSISNCNKRHAYDLINVIVCQSCYTVPLSLNAVMLRYWRTVEAFFFK